MHGRGTAQCHARARGAHSPWRDTWSAHELQRALGAVRSQGCPCHSPSPSFKVQRALLLGNNSELVRLHFLTF